eukprot:1596072-Rhodomonas_salina.4
MMMGRKRTLQTDSLRCRVVLHDAYADGTDSGIAYSGRTSHRFKMSLRDINLDVGKALNTGICPPWVAIIIRPLFKAGESAVHLPRALPEAVALAAVANIHVFQVRVVLPSRDGVVRDAAELDLGALLLRVLDPFGRHDHSDLARCHSQQHDIPTVVLARDRVHLDVDPETLVRRTFPDEALVQGRAINAELQAVRVGAAVS